MTAGRIALVGSGEYLPVMHEVEAWLLEGVFVQQCKADHLADDYVIMCGGDRKAEQHNSSRGTSWWPSDAIIFLPGQTGLNLR